MCNLTTPPPPFHRNRKLIRTHQVPTNIHWNLDTTHTNTHTHTHCTPSASCCSAVTCAQAWFSWSIKAHINVVCAHKTTHNFRVCARRRVCVCVYVFVVVCEVVCVCVCVDEFVSYCWRRTSVTFSESANRATIQLHNYCVPMRSA